MVAQAMLRKGSGVYGFLEDWLLKDIVGNYVWVREAGN